jgi:hypothetical protein
MASRRADAFLFHRSLASPSGFAFDPPSPMRHEPRSLPRLSRNRSLLPCALLLAAALPLGCSQPSPAKDGSDRAQVSDTVHATAKVVSVDKAARIVELRNEQGEVVRVRCGPEVRNFDQIAAGDTVRADYTTALAVALKAPGDQSPDGSLALGAGRAPVGATPAAGVAAQVTATVRIESVDNENHVVVFTSPNGRMQAANVTRAEGRAFLRGLKKGDRVEITYSEAAALRVEKQ